MRVCVYVYLLYVDFEFFRRKAYETLYIYVHKWPSSRELQFSNSFRENVNAYLHMFERLDNMYRRRIFPSNTYLKNQYSCATWRFKIF